jgi:lysophospholipase L1-like esterase
MFSFYMPEANVGRVSDMEEYYAAAAEICKKWNVPYLDMYHDHHLNYDVLEIQSSVCLQDPVHPNTEGYNRLAPHIAAWMETLV